MQKGLQRSYRCLCIWEQMENISCVSISDNTWQNVFNNISVTGICSYVPLITKLILSKPCRVKSLPSLLGEECWPASDAAPLASLQISRHQTDLTICIYASIDVCVSSEHENKACFEWKYLLICLLLEFTQSSFRITNLCFCEKQVPLYSMMIV